jgi:hypothetical protein
VELQKPANTVTGTEYILGNPYEGATYLSIFSSLFIQNRQDELKSWFSRTRAKCFASLLSILILSNLGSVTRWGGMTTQSMPSSVSYAIGKPVPEMSDQYRILRIHRCLVNNHLSHRTATFGVFFKSSSPTRTSLPLTTLSYLTCSSLATSLFLDAL